MPCRCDVKKCVGGSTGGLSAHFRCTPPLARFPRPRINRFTAFEAIEKTAASGAKVIEFYPGQKLSPAEPDLKFDHNATPETLNKAKAQGFSGPASIEYEHNWDKSLPEVTKCIEYLKSRQS